MEHILHLASCTVIVLNVVVGASMVLFGQLKNGSELNKAIKSNSKQPIPQPAAKPSIVSSNNSGQLVIRTVQSPVQKPQDFVVSYNGMLVRTVKSI